MDKNIMAHNAKATSQPAKEAEFLLEEERRQNGADYD